MLFYLEFSNDNDDDYIRNFYSEIDYSYYNNYYENTPVLKEEIITKLHN
jgi:hypothetical protein